LLSKNFDSKTLRFGSNSSAEIALSYPDAGRLQLTVQKTVDLGNGTSSLLQGSSNQFVVRPFGLKLAVSGVPENSTDHTAAVFKKAGENFVLTATAVQWVDGEDTNNDGIPDDLLALNNNPEVANFTGESLFLSHHLIGPDPSLSESELGAITGGTATFPTSSAPQITSATANLTWSEVGIIGLDAEVRNYLGTGDVIGKLDNIGRFVPDRFELAAGYAISPACTGSNYMDQPFSAQYQLSAVNLAGGITQNYQGDYAKAIVSLVAQDSISGQILAPRFSSLQPVTTAWAQGIYAQTAYDLAISRASTPDILPSTTIGLMIDADESVDITLSSVDFNPFTIGDCISDGNCNAKQLNNTPISFYYGRLKLTNTYGSELEALIMPLEVQYFDGSAFRLHGGDQCTSYNAVNATLSPSPFGELEPSKLADQLTTVTNGINGLLLPASQTEVGTVTLQLPVADWLKFDWDNDADQDDPQGHATFGRYRGNDRVVFWQELR